VFKSKPSKEVGESRHQAQQAARQYFAAGFSSRRVILGLSLVRDHVHILVYCHRYFSTFHGRRGLLFNKKKDLLFKSVINLLHTNTK
jgi:hypothetical protein